MKVNAPEKVYIEPSLDSIWGMTERSCESEVEYTRTNAFIEKAAKWINEHTSLSEKLVIENFVKYMRGE